MSVAGARTAKRRAWGPDGRLAFLVGFVTVGVLAVGLVPALLREQTRDWTAYAQAADRLRVGGPLYYFDTTTPDINASDEEPYLYPPPLAAAWWLAGDPFGFLVLKIAALLAVGSLGAVVARGRRERLVAGAGLAIAALFWLPDLHDLILGNVMAFYVGAVALSVSQRSGWGSVPLGILCAFALKPAIGPYLLWLLIRRRDAALAAIVAGLAMTVVTAVALGPGRYIEYLAALPMMSALAHPFSGNMGLISIGPWAVALGLAAAYVLTAVGAMRLDLGRSAAMAIAMTLLAQPTIGFNYAGLLLPAIVMLWTTDRPAGLLAIVVVPIVVILSPIAAALVVVAAALARPIGRALAEAGHGN